MAKGHKQNRRRKQIVPTQPRRVNEDKKIALSGWNGSIPASPVVSALGDLVTFLYWEYLKAHGADSKPTMDDIWTAYPGKQSQITARLNEAEGALQSSLSRGVPTVIEGGDDNPEWDLLDRLFAEPSKFKATRKDGKPWEPMQLLDYGNDRPVAGAQASGSPTK